MSDSDAAPLTAEQIAAIAIPGLDYYDAAGRLCHRIVASDLAALRDRLARAEAALRAVVAHAGAGAETGAYEQALFDCRFDAANALGLLATPTDGAARAGAR